MIVGHFQYPQPDRYPCNASCAQDHRSVHTFQYPQPDRYPCNISFVVLVTPILGLSVSSTGSISLQQHCRKTSRDPPSSYFQYPQPDRYPCNSSWPCPLLQGACTFSI